MNSSFDFIRAAPWRDAELMLAKSFKLPLLDASPVTIGFLEQEIAQSDFGLEDIKALLSEDRARLLAFSIDWNADCRIHEYGEEWDPAEGNQQEDAPPPQLIGIGQGFLITHSLFFLYAKLNPTGLLAFVKRRRIPHAKQVARDIVRVFKNVTPRDIHA
jgi:hypothetical protein